MAGLSLSLTGCHRSEGPMGDGGILPLSALSGEMRSRIPAYTPGANVSVENPPLNAYDENLGYYHQQCSAWFPYPYDYYDSRWGYYRCGRWSKYNSNRTHYTNHRTTTGTSSFSSGNSTSDPSRSSTSGSVGEADYSSQPSGAPVHAGVAHSQASSVRASTISRGGFGSTGRASSSFSSSS